MGVSSLITETEKDLQSRTVLSTWLDCACSYVVSIFKLCRGRQSCVSSSQAGKVQ